MNLKPILVCGAHRTGTTWVGKMLAIPNDVAYISEPLNVHHRRGVFDVLVKHWYTYICADNEEQYLPAFKETLSLRYHLWKEILSLRSRKDFLRMGRDMSIFFRGRLSHARPLLKDPFAVFSLNWFAQRLGCALVVTIRHPLAFASSLKRLGWRFDFSDLLAQPLLMRDGLEPYRIDMENMLTNHDDLIGQASLQWRMVYDLVEKQNQILASRQFPVYSAKHEDLSLDPVNGFRELYQRLGLAYNAKVEKVIITSSGEKNPSERSKNKVHTVRLDSRANLDVWQKWLSQEEIKRVLDLTEDIRVRYYP